MAETEVKTKPEIIPRHRWTNGGEHVLILKCTDANGKSYNDFQWPESGPVVPEKWSREQTCESGGLFGWAWGFSFGEGKEPNYAGRWIVFRAHPDDVIEVEGKVKAVPNPEFNRTPEVVFCGTYPAALAMILPGHIAWVKHASSGAATASGDRGAATASGYRGAATASGDSGAAVVTGEYAAIEVSPSGLAAVRASEFYWRVRTGAVLVQRSDAGHWIWTSETIAAQDGDLLHIRDGVVIGKTPAA